MAIPLDADRSLVASRSSLHQYSWSTGELAKLGEWTFEEDVRFNDGGLSPTGELFIGTMSMERRPEAGALFHVNGRKLTKLVDRVGISNGLVWSEPAKGWYVDSLARTIYRIEVTDRQWSVTPSVVFEEDEEPDGLALLSEGTLACAMWGGGRLALLSGEGSVIGSSPVPGRFPTSIATNGTLAIVTSANPDSEIATADGSVFIGELPLPEAAGSIP